MNTVPILLKEGSFHTAIKITDLLMYLVENRLVDEESLESMIIFGNSFANEIIVYLEKYIDEDLRNEIKLQYRKDLTPPKL